MARALKKIKASAKRTGRSNLPYLSSTFRVHAKERERALVARLRRTYKEHGVALYLGAGVSASAGFPAWGGLISELLGGVLEREVFGTSEQQLKYETENAWPRSAKKFPEAVESVHFENSRPLIMLARMLRGHLKGELPNRVAGSLYYESILGQWLADPDWVKDFVRGKTNLDFDLMSSPLINAIADIALVRPGSAGIKAIVNYNFDDLADEVIRQRGTHCSSVSSPGDAIAAGALPCYHVHGILPLRAYAASSLGRHGPRRKVRGDFVFSEEEYHRQYAEPFRWSNLIQTSLLGSLDGLFVGLSLEDPNIRRLLDATHRQYPRRRNYAILRRQRPLATAGRSLKQIVINVVEQIESGPSPTSA